MSGHTGSEDSCVVVLPIERGMSVATQVGCIVKTITLVER